MRKPNTWTTEKLLTAQILEGSVPDLCKHIDALQTWGQWALDRITHLEQRESREGGDTFGLYEAALNVVDKAQMWRIGGRGVERHLCMALDMFDNVNAREKQSALADGGAKGEL